MQLPKEMYLGQIRVEVLRRGHFPTTAIVKNLGGNGREYEVDITSLRHTLDKGMVHENSKNH